MKKYDYDWYKESSEKYQKLYKQDFDLKNKYFLLSVGGTVAILIPLLDKFGNIVKIFLLLEVALLIIFGFLVLYSLLKEVEVHEKYLENYTKVYENYGEQEITEENSKIINEILSSNKFYDESIKNERNIKKFFKIIIYYTIFLLISIVLREGWMVSNNKMMLKNKVHTEGVKPLIIKIIREEKLNEKNKDLSEEEKIKKFINENIKN